MVDMQLKLLAQVLDVEPTETARFECLRFNELSELISRISDFLFDDQADMFTRIGALSPLAPTTLVVRVAHKAVPPLAAGRIGGALGVAHQHRIASVIAKLSCEYMAQCAPHLDPRAVEVLASAIDPEVLLPVAEVLIRDRNFGTAGRFIEFAPAETIRFFVDRIHDDETLLRTAAHAQSSARLNNLLRVVPAERLMSVVHSAAHGPAQLKLVLLAVLSRLDEDLIDTFASAVLEDEETTSALVEAAYEVGSLTEVVGLVEHLGAPDWLINYECFHDPAVHDTVLATAQENDAPLTLAALKCVAVNRERGPAGQTSIQRKSRP